MHILLIGLGNMGQKYLSKIKEMGESPVLCDIDPSKSVDGHPFYCHYGDVKEELKGVIVAVDPRRHVEIAKEFLTKNIPVLLEKPPALSPEDFEEIENFPNLYVSEVESYSVCLEYFPSNVESIEVYRFGRTRGYISPLWDLGWHDLYLLFRFFDRLEIEKVEKGESYCLEGTADGKAFKLCVAWEHPKPQRRWIINGGEWLLDFGEESVYREGKLVVHRKRDKLRWMLEDFLFGRYDRGCVSRAKKILNILSTLS